MSRDSDRKLNSADDDVESSDKTRSSRRSHLLIVIVGGTLKGPSSLEAAIRAVGIDFTLQYATSVGDAIAVVNQICSEGALETPDLIIVRQTAIMPSPLLALARMRREIKDTSLPYIVVTMIDDPILNNDLLNQDAQMVVPEDQIPELASAIRQAVVDKWF